MLSRIRDAGGVTNYDLIWFAFSNVVDCKTKEKVCKVSKHSDKVDASHTKALIGRQRTETSDCPRRENCCCDSCT